MGKFDFESVVFLRAGGGEGGGGGGGEGLIGGGVADEGGFGFVGAPGFGGDSAEADARLLDDAAIDVEHHGGGGEGELVGGAVAHFEVGGFCGEGEGSNFDGGDEFAGGEDGFSGGVVAVGDVELLEGDFAFGADFVVDDGGCVEGGEGDAHVGGVGGDALVAGAEEGVHAVEAVDGRAAGAGLALVAGIGGVAEIGAAGALHEVAGGGGHVAELRGSAGEQGGGEDGVAFLHEGVIGEISCCSSCKRRYAGCRRRLPLFSSGAG